MTTNTQPEINEGDLKEFYRKASPSVFKKYNVFKNITLGVVYSPL